MRTTCSARPCYGDASKLKNPEIVTAIAADRAAFQLTKLAAEAKQAHPTIVDVLMTPGLRLREKAEGTGRVQDRRSRLLSQRQLGRKGPMPRWS